MKKEMFNCFGIGLIVFGVILGLWLGVWVMFIGGIIQIAKSVQPTVISMGIAWGIIRILLAGLVGWGSAVCLIMPGIFLISD